MAEKKPATLIAGERFIPHRLFNGVFIPNVLLETDLISPVDKIVWGRLCQFAGENGVCFPSFSTIATKTAISRSGAIKSVNALVEKGFLEKRVPNSFELGRQCSNHYYFLLHSIFLEAFRPPSTQNQPALVHSVDQPSSQSRPKEIHKENQEKHITTTRPVEGGSPSLEECGGRVSSLSEEQLRYIQLKVDYMESHGQLRQNARWPLENDLKRRALKGTLDMSDFEHLTKWQSAQAAPRHSEGCLTLPDKAALHAEIEAVDREARKWLASLPPSHPARSDKKPSLMTEDIWIRCQYQKYNQSGEMKDVA